MKPPAGTDHRTKLQPCPHCSYPLDAAFNPDAGRGPEPGDATVCINCAALLYFGEGMTLHEYTVAELEALPADELMDMLKVRAIVVRTQEDLFNTPPGAQQGV